MAAISHERFPEAVRAFFNSISGLTGAAVTGSLARKNGSCSGGVRLEADRLVLTYNESLRMEGGSYTASRGSMITGIVAAQQGQTDYLSVNAGALSGEGVEVHTIAGLEVEVTLSRLTAALDGDAGLPDKLSWLWDLLRLVLRLESSDKKSVAARIAMLQPRAESASASEVTPQAPIPVVAAPETAATATGSPAAPAADPLAVDDDFFVNTSGEQEAADPMAALDEAQRAIVTQLHAGMSAFDIKGSKIRGPELKAALAFQSAGGVFTRTTKGRDDKPVTGEVRIGMDGKVQPVAKAGGITIKPGKSALDRVRGNKKP